VIEQCREVLAEDKPRQFVRAQRQARPVAQDQPGATVAQNEFDGRRRQLPVDWHRDQTCSHDAKKRGEKLAAIDR
jgi:hypothetical protein